MSSSLQTLRNLIQVNIGNRDDTDAILVMNAAINYSALLAALVFDPPELKKSATSTLAIGQDSLGLTSLTNLLDVITLYNVTDSFTMWFFPFEQWHTIVPSTVGLTKYYTIYGETLYFRDVPTADKVLRMFHSNYPSALVNLGDTLSFDHHDSYIISLASAICFAAFEEAEGASMWKDIASAAGSSLMLGARARQVIAGREALLENAITQAQGGK